MRQPAATMEKAIKHEINSFMAIPFIECASVAIMTLIVIIAMMIMLVLVVTRRIFAVAGAISMLIVMVMAITAAQEQA